MPCKCGLESDLILSVRQAQDPEPAEGLWAIPLPYRMTFIRTPLAGARRRRTQAAPRFQDACTTEAVIHAAGGGGLGASALGAAGDCGAVAGEVAAACGDDPAGSGLMVGFGVAAPAAGLAGLG